MKSEVAEYIQIESQEMLYTVVESLSDLLQRGIIEEVTGNCRLSDIQKGKSLPTEVIEIEFIEHKTKLKFKLSVETYHGSGGSFKKIG